MKKTLAVASIIVILAATALASPPFPADPPQSKVLTGRILDPSDNPLPGAVVYLTNTRTRAVKTYIAGREGDYRFPGLANNTDYEVYAQFQGHKSDTKSVSQFDSRAQANINLKIDMK